MGKMITKVRKRDGRIVEFDEDRITNAIFKAAQAVGGHDKDQAKSMADRVVTILEYQFSKEEVPTVEEIQDLVEKVLIKAGHAKTAKSYILYRQQHAKLRATKATYIDVVNTISSYLGKNDWRVKENSNEDFSFSGMMLYISGKVIANYMLNEVYSQEVSEAHKKGYMHIHDLSTGVVGYCAGWSLKNLLVRGFGNVPNKVDAKPAKHMGVVVHQMVNYIGCVQMEFAGAQAFSSVDTLLAPFVKADNLTYKQVKQNMQMLVFSLNIPSRWGGQTPFTNLTFDWIVPEDMKNEKAIVGGEEQGFTYGDCQSEMNLINRAFIEVLMEGDANGRIFTFPIPTYNLTKEFDWESENAKYLFELTAKYGSPYFQNYIGSNLDPRSIRAMCCRLNLDMKQLINRPGHIFAAGDSTGSLGVVTINLNRMAYEAQHSKQRFFQNIERYMVLAKEALEVKRKVVNKNLESGLMPYTKTYLGSFRNHFSTIGLCGMHEACVNLIGEGIQTGEGKALAIETLTFMKNKMRDFQEETGNLYNLEATPAESASFRLAKADKEMYPDIYTAGTDIPYLTNSTHLPVSYTDDVVDALTHQNDIQPLYTGGTIFHTFLGERMTDWKTAMMLVKKIAHNTRIPYFTITPTFSICPDHGYIVGEHFSCPVHCEKEQVIEEVN